ncbi:Phosphatidylinositol 4-phosphate 5-kinase type-1 alpha, partial [Orchesella cincta]
MTCYNNLKCLVQLLFSEDRLKTKQVHFSTSSDDSSVFHSEVDFRFKTYAPPAFDHFRGLFGVSQEDFLVQHKNSPLRELSSSGASGSLFYISKDDEFILKTVQRKERRLLLQVLEDYYQNLKQNPRTLLPKFFGLYNYIPKTGGNKNIRFVVMNNVLPSALKMDWKYDLKGSTYNRRASLAEKMKPYPTFKDLDFVEHFPGGLILEEATYNALMRTLDLAASENSRQMQRLKEEEKDLEESKIQKRTDENWFGGIPARSRNGDNLLVFLGIIDILQSYRLSKKLEHTWKAVVYD